MERGGWIMLAESPRDSFKHVMSGVLPSKLNYTASLFYGLVYCDHFFGSLCGAKERGESSEYFGGKKSD